MKPPREVFGMFLLALVLLLAGANASFAAGVAPAYTIPTEHFRIVEGSLGPSTGKCGELITVHATLQTDSGTGDVSWVPAVGQEVHFGFSATGDEPAFWPRSAITDANGQATVADIVVPSGAATLWAHYSPMPGTNYNSSIAFNTPALVLTVSDATYDGKEHAAIAILTDSCGNSQTLDEVGYSGKEGTSYPMTFTPPTNVGRYEASVTYMAPPYYFSDYKPFTIAPAKASVTPNSFTRQYSDPNPPLTGALNSFLARDGVTASYSTPADSASAPGDYPTEADLAPKGTPGEGNYDVTSNRGVMKVLKEDAHVSFDPTNPATLPASTPGGALNAGALTLRVHVQELPDLPDGAAMAGDINNAGLAVTLTPATGPALPLNCSAPAAGAGYATRTFTCINGGAIPVGAYEVSAAVTGDFYAGAEADVFTVDDPISGFATGGGWFSWPGAGEKTNFAFIARPDKGGARLKGNLLVIRHHPDGTISRLKSTALDELKLQNADGCRIATFSGKGTYRTWNAAAGTYVSSGGHAFTVYAEDCGNPGSGGDSFWIGAIGDLVMPAPASGNKAPLGGGNIVVPHRGKP